MNKWSKTLENKIKVPWMSWLDYMHVPASVQEMNLHSSLEVSSWGGRMNSREQQSIAVNILAQFMLWKLEIHHGLIIPLGVLYLTF